MDPNLSSKRYDEYMSKASSEDDATLIDDASLVRNPAIEHACDSQAHHLDPRPDVSVVAKNFQLIQSVPTVVEIHLEGQETIAAYQAILRYYSPWFAKRFEKDDACGVDVKPIQVSIGDSGVFRSFLHWMYYNQIIRFNGCAYELPWLVRLWVMADLYEVPGLCNETIDMIYWQVNIVALDAKIAHLIWNTTKPDSKLRQLLVRRCARHGRLHRFRANGMPVEFCTLLVNELFKLKNKYKCDGGAA